MRQQAQMYQTKAIDIVRAENGQFVLTFLAADLPPTSLLIPKSQLQRLFEQMKSLQPQ